MSILTTAPLSAQLLLVCILLPFFAGAIVWITSALGTAQKDKALCAISTFLFYATPLAILIILLSLCDTLDISFAIPHLCGLGLSFALDGLRMILCLLTASCWVIATIFTPSALVNIARKNRFHLFLLLTEGATLGVFLSADLYTTLVFFEIMSITSWVLVAHNEEPDTKKAADSYLAFAVLGGLASLMGLFLLYETLHTLSFAALAPAAAQVADKTILYVAGALTLIGFAAKAGMFPLHTWMPLAYVAAPAPATALLSAILSKAGLFGILVLSTQLFMHDANFGMAILTFGLITMLTGAVLGVFSVHLKRTLACSSMSQIGFILVGVGMQGILGEEGGMALWGLVLHLCNHSLFKMCLFFTAGVVFANLGELDLNKIRGFGRGKPVLAYTFGMAALGIMGVPLWSGYISKTLLHESIVEAIVHFETHGHPTLFLECAEWIFLFSGGLTVVYMLKLFVCLFIEKNADASTQARYDSLNHKYIGKLPAVVLVFMGSLSLPLGSSAHFSMEHIAQLANAFAHSASPEHAVHYFSLEALSGGAISLSIGLVLYFALVRTVFIKDGTYRNLWPRALNLEDTVYRPLLLCALPFIGALVARFIASLFEWLCSLAHAILFFGDNNGIVVPQEDMHFSIYEKEPKGIRGFVGSLTFSLILFGLGMMSILIYLLNR